MMKNFVLDANALISYFQGGAGAAKVEQLLLNASRLQQSVLMSVLNWGEVFYLIWQRAGEEKARQMGAALPSLCIQLVPVDLPQALKAGELKAVHKIPYVDCVAVALAIQEHATLVTSDRDFEKLGRHFPVVWVQRS